MPNLYLPPFVVFPYFISTLVGALFKNVTSDKLSQLSYLSHFVFSLIFFPSSYLAFGFSVCGSDWFWVGLVESYIYIVHIPSR